MKFDNGHHARMSVSGAIGGALYGKERLAGRAAFNASTVALPSHPLKGSFTDLPGEIRNKIYKNVLEDYDYFYEAHYKGAKYITVDHKIRAPGLFYVSKQVHQEVRSIYYTGDFVLHVKNMRTDRAIHFIKQSTREEIKRINISFCFGNIRWSKTLESFPLSTTLRDMPHRKSRYPLHVPGPCVVPNPSRAFADSLASVGAVGRTTRQSDEYIVQASEQWWLEWNQRTYKKYLKDKEAQDKQYGAFVLDPSLFDS